VCEALSYLPVIARLEELVAEILEDSSLDHVSLRQPTSAYVSLRQPTSAYVSIRQHTSAYVSIRQHTSAYVSILEDSSLDHALKD
jgi:hypothetical protein